MHAVVYFWLLFKGSLFSFSGLGNVPSVHADFVARHWATEQQFAEALMVGQLSPGPTGLWVLSLGYMTYGFTGAALAFAAVNLPPFLVLAIERGYERVKHHPAVEGFMRGLGLAVAGIFAVVLFALLQSNGINAIRIGIAALAFALGLSRRAPVLPVLGLGAVLGLFWR